ncbi:MAG: DNA alkylation repair protein [bacterium]|nr:DNA alkylation repair protein [bacterium]MCP4968357.1 DNA alkylation repair protein [bacterium]
MKQLIALVADELASRADAEKAVGMAAYMKTDMPFYGVQKKGRTEVYRAMKAQFPVTDNVTYRRYVTALWERPHREEKYLAIRIAEQNRQFVVAKNLDLYRRLIVEGAWWDFVDAVAVHCVGIAFLQEREATQPSIERWIDDDDMWLRRTSLISHLKHKAETDCELLFDHCMRRAGEKEFFIRKAIGWSLREYAKTSPDRVTDFLIKNRDQLSGLSFREASKHLEIPL